MNILFLNSDFFRLTFISKFFSPHDDSGSGKSSTENLKPFSKAEITEAIEHLQSGDNLLFNRKKSAK